MAADTLVPSLSNPADLNRHGYVRDNPANLSDTTGHTPNGGPDDAEFAGSKSVTFSIPQVDDIGVISVALWIDQAHVGGYRGDGPLPDAWSPHDARATITLDFEHGIGTVVVNKTCKVAGSCTAALPIVRGRGAHIPMVRGNKSNVVEPWITEEGGFVLNYSLRNSQLGEGCCNLDGSLAVFPAPGEVAVGGARQSFPSMLIQRTFEGHTTTLASFSEYAGRGPVSLFGWAGIEYHTTFPRGHLV